MTAACPMAGIAASTSSVPAAAMIDHTNTYSRRRNSTTLFDEAIPIPIPMPNEVTRIPHPGSPAPRDVLAKIGPSASTAPTALKAETIPSAIDDASEFSRRNRTPSAMSLPTRERSSRANEVGASRGIWILLTSKAESPNVNASSHSARNDGLSWKYGNSPEPPERNVNTRAPSGSVAYVVIRPSELALASWRRGTRFGSDASRAGVHSNEKHSITKETPKIAQSGPRNGMRPYRAPRATSAVIITVLRLTRSTIAPAIGPNTIAGSVRATITPAIAYAPASPPLLTTSAVTATNPTQSPNELTVCAASSLEKAGWVMRSLKVAGRVPRSAATSSAKVDTYSSAAATPAGSAVVSVSSAVIAPGTVAGSVVFRFVVVPLAAVRLAVVRLAVVRLAALRFAVVRLGVVFFFAPALAAA